MAAAAHATPSAAVLSPFEGKDVLSSTVAIRRAGDGLSAALKVDPAEYQHGEVVYVVLKTTVEKIRHDPVKDTDGLQRVHMLVTETATVVDEGLVSEHLEQQALRIEKAAGIARLPGMDGPAIFNDPAADPLGALDGEPGEDGSE